MMSVVACGLCPSITAPAKMKMYFMVRSYSGLLLMSGFGFGSKLHQNLLYFTVLERTVLDVFLQLMLPLNPVRKGVCLYLDK